MKKLPYVLVLVLGFVASSIAQNSDGRLQEKREQLRAQKVARLTVAMKLTPEESQVFWAVYNELDEELSKIRKERRKLSKSLDAPLEELEEDALNQRMDREFELREKEIQLRKEYHVEFKKLIGVEKTARLYVAEKEFNRDLVRGVREKAQRSQQARPRRSP